MSRIEQMISDIESYIDNCKFQPLSNTKIIVNKEQLEDMLNELRLKTPEEVKKYQKILNNKDAIIADAKEQAETIVNAAQIRTEELINEQRHAESLCTGQCTYRAGNGTGTADS